MGIEEVESQTGEPVFATSQLVWLDEETGDVFEIEVIGTVPWVEELASGGFTPPDGAESSARRYHCRIEFAPRPA